MIDAYASQVHYHDHIWPIWEALETKGRFVVHPSIADRRPHDEVGAFPPPNRRTPIIVAGHPDLTKTARKTTVLVEHGAGQTYETPQAGYAGGPARGRVALFLCPNEQVAEKNRARYPDARVDVVGSPRVEWLHKRRQVAEELAVLSITRRPVVAFSFHFDCTLWPEAEWALPYYRQELASLIPKLKERFDVLGHGHPRAWGQLRKFWEKVGAEPVEEFTEIVERADLYVCDNSSTIFEAAAVGIPVVLLNQPRYRRDMNFGLRFWEWAGIGPQVDHPADLEAGIDAGLDGGYEWEREQMRSVVYNAIDGSARRATASIAKVCS
jgi:hypothetical protein